MLKENRILVTGSAGLIGTVLTKKLVTHGKLVIGLDIGLPKEHTNYGNIFDTKKLKDLINQCVGIVHLSAISRVVWGENNPELCWQTNVQATKNLLELVHHSIHKPWVIFASSREVYGQQAKLPVPETAELLPLNVYARSKVAGEQLIHEYQKLGVTASTLRFSNVYGGLTDHPDRVIPAFCRNALLNKPLRVDGNNNLFDFTHVDDTVNGIICVINKLSMRKASLPDIHLTTGKGTDLVDVIKIIEKTLENTVEFYQAPARNYDVQRFYGDTTLAKNILNWQAVIPIEKGIKQLLQMYQQQLQISI